MKERLQEDLKNALKNGNSGVVSTLRFLLAQIQSEEIRKRGQGGPSVLSNEEIIAVLKAEAKRRLEAIAMFRQGKREDLAVEEEKAISIIQQYLPPALDQDQVREVVRGIHRGGVGDFSSLMKQSMAALRGQADGRMVSEIVKEILNG